MSVSDEIRHTNRNVREGWSDANMQREDWAQTQHRERQQQCGDVWSSNVL